MPTVNLGRIGFVSKGTWSAGTYKHLDFVRHANATWVCGVLTTTGEPGVSSDWDLAINDGSSVASGITNTPAGDISAVTVQGAIDELDTEKASQTSLTAVTDTIGGNTSGDLLTTDDTQDVTQKDFTDCTANTQSAGDGSTNIATTAYADAASSAAAGLQGWKLLANQTVQSGVNGENMVITSIPTGYRLYKLLLVNVIPDADNAVLRVHLSNTNGASFYETNGNYVGRWSGRPANTTVYSEQSLASSSALITAGNSDAGFLQGVSGEIDLYSLTVAKYTLGSFKLIYETDIALFTIIDGAGRLDFNTVINALRISLTTGAADGIASGSIQLLGLK